MSTHNKITDHGNYDADDYAYLIANGWTDAQILARWDTEAKSGKGPCRWQRMVKFPLSGGNQMLTDTTLKNIKPNSTPYKVTDRDGTFGRDGAPSRCAIYTGSIAGASR